MIIANNPISMSAAIVPYEIILLPFFLFLLFLLLFLFLLLSLLFLRLRRRPLLLGPSDGGVIIWSVNYGTYEYISFYFFLLLLYY
jgi:hypothetical protein